MLLAYYNKYSAFTDNLRTVAKLTGFTAATVISVGTVAFAD